MLRSPEEEEVSLKGKAVLREANGPSAGEDSLRRGSCARKACRTGICATRACRRGFCATRACRRGSRATKAAKKGICATRRSLCYEPKRNGPSAGSLGSEHRQAFKAPLRAQDCLSQGGTRETGKDHLDSLRGTREAGKDSLDSLRGTREAGKDPLDSLQPGRHQGGTRETGKNQLDSLHRKGPRVAQDCL